MHIKHLITSGLVAVGAAVATARLIRMVGTRQVAAHDPQPLPQPVEPRLVPDELVEAMSWHIEMHWSEDTASQSPSAKQLLLDASQEHYDALLDVLSGMSIDGVERDDPTKWMSELTHRCEPILSEISKRPQAVIGAKMRHIVDSRLAAAERNYATV